MLPKLRTGPMDKFIDRVFLSEINNAIKIAQVNIISYFHFPAIDYTNS